MVTAYSLNLSTFIIKPSLYENIHKYLIPYYMYIKLVSRNIVSKNNSCYLRRLFTSFIICTLKHDNYYLYFSFKIYLFNNLKLKVYVTHGN